MRILLLVILLVPLVTEAQRVQVTRRFYTSTGARTDSVNSYYFNVDSVDVEWERLTSFYTASGKPRFIEAAGSPHTLKTKTYFYPSGQRMAEGTFYGVRPRGKLEIDYPDGRPMAELVFQEGLPRKMEQGPYRIMQYWDSAGVRIIENGKGKGVLIFPELNFDLTDGEGEVVDGFKNGTWTGDVFSATYSETYKHGTLVAGALTADDGNVYRYEKIEEAARPVGGAKAYYRYIRKNIKYPKPGITLGAGEVVYTEFIVNKDGSISDVRIVRGVNFEFDAEAVRVIAASPHWIPGTQRGRPVRQRMVLPIKFYTR